jgi:hypothetical protein
VHLQWHQLVFELAVGRPIAAAHRYLTWIQPAVARGEALTDGPAGLWRIALAAPTVRVCWADVRAAALAHLEERDGDRYVTLHSLLALCGAGDVTSLTAWIARFAPRTVEDHTLLAMAHGLRAFAAGDFVLARASFDVGVPRVSQLGGSHAQNDLFRSLRDRAAKNAGARNNARCAHSTEAHTQLSTVGLYR